MPRRCGGRPIVLRRVDAVRLIDLSGSTGYGVWTGEGQGKHPSSPDTLLGGADELPARLGDSPAATQAFDISYARLRDLVPSCPADRHLIHHDLLHHNILASDGRITAFLDWAARASVTVYDIAWLTFWAEWFPRWDGIDFCAAALEHYGSTAQTVDHFAERLRAYELEIRVGKSWLVSRPAAITPTSSASRARRASWPQLH